MRKKYTTRISVLVMSFLCVVISQRAPAQSTSTPEERGGWQALSREARRGVPHPVVFRVRVLTFSFR